MSVLSALFPILTLLAASTFFEICKIGLSGDLARRRMAWLLSVSPRPHH